MLREGEGEGERGKGERGREREKGIEGEGDSIQSVKHIILCITACNACT